MYISFFHFEVVRVTHGDCRVVIFARIRIDNLPVHLGCKGTSNGSRVYLQLLKELKRRQWTQRVGELAVRNRQILVCQNQVKTLLEKIQLNENAMQS